MKMHHLEKSLSEPTLEYVGKHAKKAPCYSRLLQLNDPPEMSRFTGDFS